MTPVVLPKYLFTTVKIQKYYNCLSKKLHVKRAFSHVSCHLRWENDLHSISCIIRHNGNLSTWKMVSVSAIWPRCILSYNMKRWSLGLTDPTYTGLRGYEAIIFLNHLITPLDSTMLFLCIGLSIELHFIAHPD